MTHNLCGSLSENEIKMRKEFIEFRTCHKYQTKCIVSIGSKIYTNTSAKYTQNDQTIRMGINNTTFIEAAPSEEIDGNSEIFRFTSQIITLQLLNMTVKVIIKNYQARITYM